MQFLLIAYDGTDPDALDRRLKVREEHFSKAAEMKRSGELLFGGAILDEKGKMKGSALIYEFPDREALDLRLKDEPYITGSVWKKIDIQTFRLANLD